MIALLAALTAARADEVVYDDALGPLWYSWSWTGIYDFNATARVHSGATSIYGGIGGNGGLSIHRVGGFAGYSAIRFWIEGDGPPIVVRFEDTALELREDLPIADLATLVEGVWNEVTISLDALPAGGWDRVSWVDVSGTGAVIYVDDIELLDVFDVPTPYSSAEPVGTDRVLLRGNDGELAITVDGRAVDVVETTVEGGPTRTYAQLAEPLSSGTWVVQAGDATFTRTIAERTVTVGATSTHDIEPAIYGANFPDEAPAQAMLDRYGYTSVRWGGNARARYNPFARTTNLGSDWYFHNELVNPSAENWVALVDDDAVDTMITVPNLDWVADGSEFWAYSVETYGEQQAVAPDNEDAGNGILLDGTPITWNDPSEGSEPWTQKDAAEWLSGFGPKLPTWATIGNETDIAHLTHRPVVSSPPTYEDQRDRFLTYASTVKDAMPGVSVSGPASCCWYYYWNSGAPSDHVAGGDFLPWFLDEVAAADSASGQRTLDALDVHYYPEGLLANGWLDLTDPVTNEWRLTATRSLWDPSFVDDSWVGTSVPVTDQPDPHVVQLLPRLRALLDAHYPDTQLAVSEWSFGGERDLSGGLATADALGIFGAYDLDMAMIWPAPAPATPTASAFELIRTGDLTLADHSLPVTGFDPNEAGVYAAEHTDGRITVLLVNKDPDVDLLFHLDGVPHGLLRVEHFGGALVDRITEDAVDRFEGQLVVPAYSALLAQVVPLTDPPPPPPPETTDTTTDTGDATVVIPPVVDQRCGCAGPASPVSPLWLAPWLLAWRIRRGSYGSCPPFAAAERTP